MEVCYFHHKGNILMICSTKKKMANTKAISTPMASEVQFSMRNDGPFQDAILYRRIAIIYVKPFGHTWESHQKDIGVLERDRQLWLASPKVRHFVSSWLF